MRPYRKYFLIVSLLSVIASCSEDNDKWGKITSQEGGFTITMPSSAKKSDKKEVTAFGKQTTRFLSWRPGSFAIDKFKLFQVSYNDCPPRVSSDSVLLNTMLDSCINMRKKDFTEGDIQAEAIELNGYPGRAFIYEGPNDNSIAIVKECIVNNRKYDLTVITKKNYSTNPEINTFFNSFQVLK